MKLFTTIFLTCLLLAPLPAWGPTGHRIVGQIAMNHLSAKAKLEIEKILGHHDLALVSNWADEIRGQDEYRYLAPWHYVSINDDETYESSPKNPKGDVVQAILKCEATLKDASQPKAKRVEALKLLVHFVGDVHQPLHVGRREDRGGNEIDVIFFDEPTDLHKVWDSKMINFRQLSFTEYARFLDHYSASDLQKLQGASILDWVAESKSYREKVYTFDRYKEHEGKEVPNLRYEYRDIAVPIIEQRLAESGVRLAGRLNAIFAD